MADPKIYDIRDVICMVGDYQIVDPGEDGFGITPGAEHTLIRGLRGELGFNKDPSTAATGMISVKVVSDSMTKLTELWNDEEIFTFQIKAKKGRETSLGFKRVYIQHAIIAKPPEYKTDSKEAPSVEWTVAGYGYNIVRLGE